MTEMREAYCQLLQELGKSTGLGVLEPDAQGLLTLAIDEGRYELSMQHIEATGKILVFVQVCQLPKDCGVEPYRALLAGTLFGAETAGGYFALEPESEAVIYNYLFDFKSPADLPVDVFEGTLEKIMSLTELWAERLQEVLNAPKADEMPGEQGNLEGRLFA